MVNNGSEPVKGSEADLTSDRFEQLKSIFPEAFSEGRFDIEKLRMALGDIIDDKNTTPHIPQVVPSYVRNAVSMLDSALSDERSEAIRTLERTDHQAAREALVKALEHPIEDVRSNAAFVLEVHGTNHPQTREALVKALQHPEQRVRRPAAIALAISYQDLRALPSLIEVLALGEPLYPHLYKHIFEGIKGLDDKKIPFLLEVVNDQNKDIRQAAALALAIILPNHIFWEEEKVRAVTVPIVSALIKALEECDVKERYNVLVDAIEHVVQRWLDGLETRNIATRRISVWALSIALPSLPPAYEWGITNDDDDYPYISHYSTAPVFNRAKLILRNARKDKDEYVRECATWIFNQINK